MKPIEDDELIERARVGDLGAFKTLISRYEGRVAGIVKGMLGPAAEVKDIGQEVFIRFYESLEQYRGESSLGTYLSRIAMNLSLNELKRRKRTFWFFSSDETAARHQSVPEGLDLKEALQRAFQKLEPEFRSVATLRLVEGYTTKETATILKIPTGTVLSRLARAQKKLKEMLHHQLN
jgi:RNA polymerase sigma-70 factor (ECF subfamily)